MGRRRFKLTFDDGTVFHCAAFDSAAALEAVLATRTVVAATAGPVDAKACAPLPDPEPVHRGRPSFDAPIAEAVQALGAELTRRLNLRERARRVLKYLAQHRAPAEMPSRDTVERYLRGKNCKKNCKNGGKNRRASRSAPEA